MLSVVTVRGCTLLYLDTLWEGGIYLNDRGFGLKGNVAQCGLSVVLVISKVILGIDIGLEYAVHGGTFERTILLAQIINKIALAGNSIDIRRATLCGADEDVQQASALGYHYIAGTECALGTIG